MKFSIKLWLACTLMVCVLSSRLVLAQAPDKATMGDVTLYSSAEGQLARDFENDSAGAFQFCSSRAAQKLDGFHSCAAKCAAL